MITSLLAPIYQATLAEPYSRALLDVRFSLTAGQAFFLVVNHFLYSKSLPANLLYRSEKSGTMFAKELKNDFKVQSELT
jgi:hypothetical protein